MTPRGRNWTLIGNVGVDSGQLMVCDPCYVDGHWVRDTRPSGHPAMVLTAEGKKKFPGNKDWSWRFTGGEKYDTPLDSLGGLSINQAGSQGLVTALPNPKTDEFSYRGACSATCGDANAGTMGKQLGVAFSSGYGDGCYQVWGRRNDDGRIVEVRILMG